MLEITKKLSGGEFDVILGEPFEIQLPENPTTGYRWSLRSSGAPFVAVEKDSFQAPTGGRMGAGGVHHWSFGTAQAGVANLEMEYKRGWEEKAAETFRVTVRVKPK
jgi:inhibitor of cysteine peptidase